MRMGSLSFLFVSFFFTDSTYLNMLSNLLTKTCYNYAFQKMKFFVSNKATVNSACFYIVLPLGMQQQTLKDNFP